MDLHLKYLLNNVENKQKITANLIEGYFPQRTLKFHK